MTIRAEASSDNRRPPATMTPGILQNPLVPADQFGMEQRTPLWLSHHYPNEYDRCFRVGRRHFCRRCAVFYPAAFAVMVAALVGLRWPEDLDVWLVWLLPVPVVVEWWAEHLSLIRYSPLRNTILSLLCAPAVGVGLARYMASPGDTLFWSVVASYAVICIVPVFLGRRLSRRAERSGNRAADHQSANQHAVNQHAGDSHTVNQHAGDSHTVKQRAGNRGSVEHRAFNQRTRPAPPARRSPPTNPEPGF